MIRRTAIAMLIAAVALPVVPTIAVAGEHAANGSRCVVLARAHGSLALLNRCRACRAVAIERRDLKGRRDRDTVFVAPVSLARVPFRGAAKIKITEERSCRRTAGWDQPAFASAQAFRMASALVN